MRLELGGVTLQETSAGLSITDKAIHFVELDEESNPIRKITIDLPEGCVVNEQIKDFSLLESALNELYKQTGKLREPVAIGLPSGDSIIRLISFPKMELEDVRGTIDLNFEEHFPYQRHDAVFDLVQVRTPSERQDRENVIVLVAAARRKLIEDLLETARKAGFPAGAVEPINFAMIRAVPDAQEGLCVFADLNNVIALYEGIGIYFRKANNANGFQDILNTIQYVDTQYRNIRVKKLVLAGLNFQIGDQSNSTLELINVTDEYFEAEGMALRNVEGVQKLDIRPMEFVELERRRYSFNPNRLAFWGLMLAFLMLSIGTVVFAINGIRHLNFEMELMRDSVSDFTSQRVALTRENQQLEQQKQKAEKMLEFLQNDIPVLEIMNELENNSGEGLKFDTADFSRGLGGVTVVLDGKAEDEWSVLNATEGLKKSGKFSSVMLPVSVKDQAGRIVFKIILRVGNINGG